MLFKSDTDPELQPKRGRTLAISIAIHLLLVAIVAMNPEFLRSTPKRIIRIAGQEYDLSKTQLTELTLPPLEQPKPPQIADNRPLVQPPVPEPVQPPPPPPPPPPQPQIPSVVISPDDVLAEGARPDGQPKASRGDTSEAARAGNSAPPPNSGTEELPPSRNSAAEKSPTQIAQNTNPNALRVPNLAESLGRATSETLEEQRRRYIQGGRTGVPGQNNVQDPNFSTEEPTILSDTRGYDFGPYMNLILNRIRINWYSLIPEVARPPFNRKGRVVLVFTITENGNVEDLQVVANSGLDPLDRASVGSIYASNPFPKLPAGFDGNFIRLQITYLYNYSTR